MCGSCQRESDISLQSQSYASKEEEKILRGISTKRKQKKIETEQARKKALPERSGELSSDEDHMQTNKAASFKNLPPCL